MALSPPDGGRARRSALRQRSSAASSWRNWSSAELAERFAEKFGSVELPPDARKFSMYGGSNESESLVASKDETRQLHWAIGQLRQDGAVQLRHPGFEIRFRTDDAAVWRDRLNARLQRARRQVEGAAETAAQGVPLLCERWRGFGRYFGDTGKFPKTLRADACRLDHA